MKRGQITVFIIVGIVVLFVFLSLFALNAKVQEAALTDEQERIFSKEFYKEGLRLFVEDCLEDEMSESLLLIGKQGRIWKEQGGFIEFNDITGKEIQNEKIAYGIKKKEYSEPDAYPCKNADNPTKYCEYKYPDEAHFGKKQSLSLINIERDIQGYLKKSTVECVTEFLEEKKELANVNIKPGELTIKLTTLFDGFSVKVDYPLKFSVGEQEFFTLSKFDFFYPSQFPRFFRQAVSEPIYWDTKVVYFDYSKETIQKGGFELITDGAKTPITFPLTGLTGITIDKDNKGDFTVFTIKYPYKEIVSIPAESTGLIPKEYTYSFIRENRPPAVDYVSQLSCVDAKHDYVVIKGDAKYGSLKIIADAKDPDEEKPKINLEVPKGWDSYDENDKDELIFEMNDFSKITADMYTFTISASDDQKLSDKQEIKVLVMDKEEGEISVETPFKDADGKQIEYISLEDPFFVKVDKEAAVVLTQGGKSIDYTFSAGSYVWPNADCKKEDFEKSKCALPVTFVNKNLNVGPVEVALKSSKKICTENIDTSKKVNVEVKECIPHKNSKHPFGFPFHKLDENGNIGNDIHPFLATHACCSLAGKIEPTSTVCYKGDIFCDNGPTLKQKVKYCDNRRGNTCDGTTGSADYKPNKRLVCGDPTKYPSCQNKGVDVSCYGKEVGNVGQGTCDIKCQYTI